MRKFCSSLRTDIGKRLFLRPRISGIILAEKEKAMLYKALCYVSIALAAVTSFLLSGTLG